MKPDVFEVRAEWDEEAQVWTVTDSNVPGLVAEADTVEALQDKLEYLIPELVKENAQHIDWQPTGNVPYHLMAERNAHIRMGC